MKQYIFTFRYKKHDLQSYFDAFSCFLSPITIHYITAGWQQSPAYPLIQLCIISTSVTAEPKWAEPSRHIDSQIHTHTHTVQWYHSPGWWNDTVVGFAQLYRAKHITLRGTLPCKQMPWTESEESICMLTYTTLTGNVTCIFLYFSCRNSWWHI